MLGLGWQRGLRTRHMEGMQIGAQTSRLQGAEGGVRGRRRDPLHRRRRDRGHADDHQDDLRGQAHHRLQAHHRHKVPEH